MFIAFIGFTANAQHAFINYPIPICSSYPSVISVALSGDGNYTGGTFSSFPGLMLNSVTGAIVPSASTPGSYVVTYNVPASPPDFVAISATATVVIVATAIPLFDPVGPICVGGNTPVLPSVSNNGISGTWSPATVDNQNTSTYTFYPDASECAISTTMTIEVLPTYVPVIFAVNGFNTVYVDGNNQVVLPVELYFDIPNPQEYTYQWSDNSAFFPGATASNYIVDTASPTGNTRFYRVWATNIQTGCHTVSSIFPVLQSNGVPPPQAPRFQNLSAGSTLANVMVSGNGIRWYDSADGKTTNTTELPLTTVLTDNTTYYASQTVNGNESLERQPVTVHLTLGIGESDLVSVSYSPNPVKAFLNIKAADTIDNVSIFNMLGQVVKNSQYNQAEIAEDMSGLITGTYFVRVTSSGRTEVFKVFKE